MCPWKVFRTCFVFISQIWRERGRGEDQRFGGERLESERGFNTLMSPSDEPVARYFPSRLKDTASMSSSSCESEFLRILHIIS